MNARQRKALNHRNSKLSTGPVTDQGQQTSSQNATTHGLNAMKPYVPAEASSYETFAADRLTRLNPQTFEESILAQTILDTEWRLKRIPSLEARLLADTETDIHRTVRSLDTLGRHEARLRKIHLSAVVELENLVQLRRNREQQKALEEVVPNVGFVLQQTSEARENQPNQPTEITPNEAMGDQSEPQATPRAASSLPVVSRAASGPAEPLAKAANFGD